MEFPAGQSVCFLDFEVSMSLCSQPRPSHVSEEFIESLALSRPLLLELTEGLKHISPCPHGNERLEEESRTIDLVRMAFADKAGSEDQPAQGLFMLQRMRTANPGPARIPVSV